MANRRTPRPDEAPNAGAEDTPPGATQQAHDQRTQNPRADSPNADAIPERTIDDPEGPERAYGRKDPKRR